MEAQMSSTERSSGLRGVGTVQEDSDQFHNYPHELAADTDEQYDSSFEASYSPSLSSTHRRPNLSGPRVSSYTGLAPHRPRQRLAPLGERAAKCPVPTFVVAFLAAAVTLLAITHAEVDSHVRIELRMLRGTFLAILLSFLFLVNVRAWQAFGVDYVAIFKLGDQDAWRAPRVVGVISSCLGMGWAGVVVVVAYCIGLQADGLRRTLPFVFWAVAIGLLVNPFPCFFYR